MRWSLILSTFIAVHSTFSFGCVALAVPSSFHELARRAPAKGGKASSKTYRKNSENHDYAYKFDNNGGVTREKLKPGDRAAHGQKTLMIPGTDADHVFEDQMLKNHLAKHNLQFEKLDPKLQGKVKGIINGPKNMAPVPAGINRGKGQVIKQGMEGKSLAPKGDRDKYTLLSYGTASKTAKALDKEFKDHGHDFKGKTFHQTLRNTMNNAKILKPGQPSPPGSAKSSDAGSVKPGPRRSPRIHAANQAKPKVKMPTRKSPRTPAAAAKKP